MKKKTITIIIVAVVILLILVGGTLFSFKEFAVINPFSSGLGVAKTLWSDTEYTIVQEKPYKVIIAQPNDSEKSANNLLDEYMLERGYYEKDRMGSMITYTNGSDEEKVQFRVNKYYSVWEWV